METMEEKTNDLTVGTDVVDEAAIIKRIAAELGMRERQAQAVVNLVQEGCTVPFIARYRKEATENLDEVQVRDIEHLFAAYKNLEERRAEVLRAIREAGKLDDYLKKALLAAKTLHELEDLYAPFKKKKKTRGMIAKEKGLLPLADLMMTADGKTVEKEAEKYIKTDAEDESLAVGTAAEAIAGAKDILAERTAEDGDNRQRLHAMYAAEGVLVAKGIGDEEAAKKSTYQMYWDYSEPLKTLKPHRVLAINRGEREGALDVTIEVDVDEAVAALQRRIMPPNKYYLDAIEDSVVRLLSPAVLREIRSQEADEADEHGIGVFSENLKNLLMAKPIKGSRVLGIDPGIRTGTKCAALDETGKYLGYFLIKQAADPKGAYNAVVEAIDKYDIKIVAVGNGTGSQEVQEIVSRAICENYKDVFYTVVDESGASVYSASDIAREEFPDLDLTIRGAISMGRRLQDPLAELVKIDPKAIGVGLYQHDVNQKRLSDALDEVVGSVVNRVGVNLNTASVSLLKYVSGITRTTAKNIVMYRDEHGKITSREELHNVKGLGEKAFEQCAGFLKIPESPDPLDNTWVHPENYAAAREVLPLVKGKEKLAQEVLLRLEEQYNLGKETIADIIAELQKPSRDPREDYPAPIMQKGKMQFSDLKPGMKVTGKIRNVVDFGAFVDIGLHETGLIHISEMSDSFVKDPMTQVQVGDVKEFTILQLDADRMRISLSLKSDAAQRALDDSSLREDEKAHRHCERSENKHGPSLREGVALEASSSYERLPRQSGGYAAPPLSSPSPITDGTRDRHGLKPRNEGNGKKKVVVVRKAERPHRGEDAHNEATQSLLCNDGMTYNPFAALLKK